MHMSTSIASFLGVLGFAYTRIELLLSSYDSLESWVENFNKYLLELCETRGMACH